MIRLSSMNLKAFIFTVGFFVLLFPGLGAMAQTRTTATRPESPWHVALGGGVVGSGCENMGSYFNHKSPLGLFSAAFNVSAGYDFTDAFTMRMHVSSGRNAGACNSLQAGGDFYPYCFSNLSLFADAMYNVSRRALAKSVVPKFYAGVGLAHTYGFSKTHAWEHPWAELGGDLPHVSLNNSVLGFRLGFCAEFLFSSEVGLFVDACGEFYSDLYDGLRPSASDHDNFSGYAGFPFDVRAVVSVGIAYHF